MAQRWAGSNGDDRRAKAAVESPASSRPLRKRQEIPLPRSKDDAPVPRTARARATGATRITRPIALTPRQSKRHLWQARRALFHLRHDDHIKKGVPPYLNSYPLPLPLSLSLSLRGPGMGTFRKGSFSVKEAGPEPITDQGFEGWPLRRVRQPP
jgi:hypothetical protein